LRCKRGFGSIFEKRKLEGGIETLSKGKIDLLQKKFGLKEKY